MSDSFDLPGFLAGGWRDCAFEPFRDGVEISPLYRGEATVALLRYAPGAAVPAHRHPGLETILVLDGTQSDDRGTYGAGTLIFNPEGTAHRVWSDTGCVVLIQWSKSVQFL